MLKRAGQVIGRRLLGQGRRRAVAICAVGVAGIVAVAASHAATHAAGLINVRLGGDEVQTRLVVDLDRSVSGKLLADGSEDGRVVLLMGAAAVDAGQQGSGRGLVKRWVIDQHGDAARLQMDIAPNARVSRRFILPPADGVQHYRYVVDIAPIPADEVRLTKAQAPAAPLVVRPTKAALPLKRTIVIDAGHGGNDPGARGARGFEKDVNLAAARALKARLEKSGRYKVVLTRDSDVYIALADRVRIAQRADADLFISLHSDSGPDPSLRGASVYTLSEKASLRATRFASRDDWYVKASAGADRGVRDILFDLTQRATKNRSAAFAQTLVSHIEGRAPLLSRSHRDAGFVVLLAPDVPAVLLEMGFVSNAEDEAMLRDPEQRDRLMAAVADSIDDYFGATSKVASR